jgi:hypothetical protein
MIFIWGKKLVYRQLGHVGDFCPMCRAPRAFMVRRVGLAGHVYYITAGEGELVGHERTCKECGIELNANPATYASFSKTVLPLPELLAKTYPDFYEVLKPRLALEEQVRTAVGFIGAEERAQLIQLPFLLLSPKVESRLANVSFDLKAGLTILGAIILAPATIGLFTAFLPLGTEEGYVIVPVLLIGVGLVIWQMAGVGKRFVKAKILPTLAKTLRPLKPREDEIQGVLDLLKKNKHKLGSRMKADDLMAALTAA